MCAKRFSFILLMTFLLSAESVCVFAAARSEPGAAMIVAKQEAPAGEGKTMEGRVVLRDAIQTLEPKAVWKNFYALTQVPRPSHHEQKISAFLAQFGQGLGLETIVDDVGNVLIRKPAGSGMEKRKSVVLQAHMDMVAQKTPDKVHNFEKDPIEAYLEDGWVKADRTTLGGDDGIGVAIIMALLEEKNILYGPIEALFTVDEEEDFGGINALQPGLLQGSVYINVDSEAEGVFAIGSAGGLYVDALAQYPEDPVPSDMAGCKIVVKGLRGGHSGTDIHLGRGNAAKLMARLLWPAHDKFGVRLAGLQGGERYNVIPREASALVAVPVGKSNDFIKYIGEYQARMKDELTATEPSLSISAIPTDLPGKVMDLKSQKALLGAVYGSVDGVVRMSDSIPGLVETSTSMGILKIEKGQFLAGCFVRSAVDSSRDDVALRLAAVFEPVGAKMTYKGKYSSWKPDQASPILSHMKTVYKNLFGKDPAVVAVHSGLETSVVGAVYPKMDRISIGPTLQDVHSPDERLEAAGVKKVYDLLVNTLKEIPNE